MIKSEDLMNVIKDGILRHDDKLFIGIMVASGHLSVTDINDEEKLIKILRSKIDSMAYNILTEIQDKFPQAEIVDSER